MYRTYPDHEMLKYPLEKGEGASAVRTRMLCICDSSCAAAGTSAGPSAALRRVTASGPEAACLSARCRVCGSALPPTRIYGSRAERSWHLPAAFCSVMCGAVQMHP